MDAADEILDGLERALALEAELGVKSFEIDRSLISPPAPSPAVAPRSAAQPAVSVPAAAVAAASRPQAPSAAAADQAGSPAARRRAIAAEIAGCVSCPLSGGRANSVPGQGCEDRPDIMFAGDYPDADDVSSGLALSGRAGDFFDKMLSAMHYDRSRVFVTELCKCRPRSGSVPSPGDFAACLRHLKAQADAVKPRCIVVLVRPSTPLAFPVPHVRRGQWYRWNGIPVIATLHPSYIVKFDSANGEGLKAAKHEIWAALKAVMACLAG